MLLCGVGTSRDEKVDEVAEKTEPGPAVAVAAAADEDTGVSAAEVIFEVEEEYGGGDNVAPSVDRRDEAAAMAAVVLPRFLAGGP